jgi:hypothetical protein
VKTVQKHWIGGSMGLAAILMTAQFGQGRRDTTSPSTRGELARRRDSAQRAFKNQAAQDHDRRGRVQ